tara:strand:+ start:1287 stop:1616 length:330 start_codon:yes stop_codon:yes gene_type:complete
MPSEVFLNIQKLAGQLQYIRDFIDLPIKLTNAYRCANHNEKVGGVSDSQHLLGKAADIQVKTLPPKDLYKVVDTLAEYGRVLQGGLGEYNTFVHYDIRKTKARWDNTKK